MKTWKKILLGLLVLGLVCCGIGLMLPREWNIETHVDIAAPPAAIHPHIDRPATFTEYMQKHALGEDPASVIEFDFTGPENGVGAGWHAHSKTPMGESNVHIQLTRSEPEYGIDYQGKIETDVVNDWGSIRFSEGPDGTTRVTWTDRGEGPPILGAIFRPFIEKTMTAFFRGILVQLKNGVESEQE